MFQGPGGPFPPELTEVYELVNQGLAAEMIADQWHITRQQADEFAAGSHVSPPRRRPRAASTKRSLRSWSARTATATT